MNPYLEILHAVVDRLRTQEPFSTPPAVLVVTESDETDASRPGQGDDLQNRIQAALGKAGVAVIVYIQDIVLDEQDADVMGFRVQVVEDIAVNRAPGGTRKSNIELIHCARSLLQGWQSSDLPQWTPFVVERIDTLDTGPVFIRELVLRTQTLMSTSIYGQGADPGGGAGGGGGGSGSTDPTLVDDSLQWTDMAPAVGTVALWEAFQEVRTLIGYTGRCDAGTCTLTWKINGTAVPGLESIVIGTTSDGADAAPALDIAEGDRLTIEIEAATDCEGLSILTIIRRP